MSKAFYRNEFVPDFYFLQKLKSVNENLYPIFDSLSQRWHVWFKDRYGNAHLIYKVFERDHEGRDIAYLPLDDRVVNKLLRMDLSRRNLSATQYKDKVRQAEDEYDANMEKKYQDDSEHAFQTDKKLIQEARDALRGIS